MTEIQNALYLALKLAGIGLSGYGEFETEEQSRNKLNLRVQKEKAEGLPLFDGTSSTASSLAEEENGLIISLFLNTREVDSFDFSDNVLKSHDFKTFIANMSFKTPSILLFDVSNHYHFITAKSLGIHYFPAVTVRVKLQGKMQTVACYEGYLEAPHLCGIIQSVLLACESEIAQEAEIKAMRSLQSEQDEAYLRSLAIDREKRRKKLEAETDEHQLLESKIELVEDDEDTAEDGGLENLNLNARIESALLDLEAEPSSSERSFKFQFLFPNGSKKVRSFADNATVKTLFDYAFVVGDLKSAKVAIKSLQPELEFSSENSVNSNLSEHYELGKGVKLFVEYL